MGSGNHSSSAYYHHIGVAAEEEAIMLKTRALYNKLMLKPQKTRINLRLSIWIAGIMSQ
jgi:hypothetical protein